MSKIQIPEELRKILTVYDVVCVITDINHEVAVLVKVSAAEQISFRRAAIKYWYELALYADGPVLCLAMEILDDPQAPYSMETFLNVENEHDRDLAERLSRQSHFTLHFIDERLDYTFSKRVRHRRRQKHELKRLLQQALKHLETVENVDWYAARQRFMREVQRGEQPDTLPNILH